MVFFHAWDGYWVQIGYQAHLSASLSSLSLFSFLFSSASASLSGPPHMLRVTSCSEQQPYLPWEARWLLPQINPLLVYTIDGKLGEKFSVDVFLFFFLVDSKISHVLFLLNFHVLSTLHHFPSHSLVQWHTYGYTSFFFFLAFPTPSTSHQNECKDPKLLKLTLISPLSLCLLTSSHLSALIIIRYDCVCWCCLGNNMGCQE